MDELYLKKAERTVVFSPENPTGEKGGGSRGKPNEKLRPCIDVAPGETVVLADTDGPGCVRSIWMGGSIHWNFILRIYWDDQPYPSVECPLSAFFGYTYCENIRDDEGRFPALNSALLAVAPIRGMNAYFPMPFRKHCRITLENRSPEATRTSYYTITMTLGELPEDAMYFHATYRQSRPNRPNEAHVILDGVEGEGRFLGVTLASGTNGSNGCWVEGEAKMYIDGDEYPSVNYTGTEDYFGGSYAFGYDSALGKYQPFSGLYSGMFAVMTGNGAGRYSYQPRFMLYRFHVPDPIRFRHDFRMDLQNMYFTPHGHTSRRDDYASVAYWYQTLPSLPLKPLPEDGELDMT